MPLAKKIKILRRKPRRDSEKTRVLTRLFQLKGSQLGQCNAEFQEIFQEMKRIERDRNLDQKTIDRRTFPLLLKLFEVERKIRKLETDMDETMKEIMHV